MNTIICNLVRSTVSLRINCKMSTEQPVRRAIQDKLMKAFEPTHLEIINESHMHNVPKGAETHFKVLVVAEKFANVPLLKRHRMVNEVLGFELQNGVHALSILAKTPDQWNVDEQSVEPSPNCRGGFGK
ncbi:bolA-like protein DDB_G0274169 isoform X2 [Ctenocephalides felis]|uniref:bolA-like protein DDB_G0274169 isoform X2 n=1 Tax=Ctenocephalides felis TaxID=7515 RepID=UPI000E6E5086|nr:bolA-like protein DDB_G0274169 isoform X2 [Ctenocephalides felis]